MARKTPPKQKMNPGEVVLRESRELYRLLQGILQSSSDGILVVNRENEVLFANDRFIEMWMIPQELMAAKDDTLLLQYVLDQLSDPMGFLQKVQELYHSTEESFETLYFKDGRVFKRLSRPLMQAAELRGRVWSFRDVTERKQAEENLRRSEERYRLISNVASDYVFSTIVDEDGLLKLNWVAGAFESMTGYTFEEYVARGGWRAMLHPDDLEMDDRDLQTLHKNQKVISELRTLKKDGSVVWVRVYAHPIWDEQAQKLAGIYGAVQNINEQKQAEVLLRESEERYRSLFDRMMDGVYRSTHGGKFVDVNPAMVEMFGYSSREEMLEVDIKNKLYFAPEERDSHVLDTGQEEADVYRMRRKDGSEIWVEDHGFYVHDDRGRVIYHEGILRDITGRKQTELELKHRTEDLELISTLNELVNRGENLDGLIDTLSSEARRIYSARVCTVFLLSPDGQVLTIPHLTIPPSIIEKIEQLIGQSLPKLQIPIKKGGYIHQRLEAEQGVITSDPELIQQWMLEFAESTFISPVLRGLIRKLIPKIYGFLDIDSTLTVPLISNNKTIGLLEIAGAGLYTSDDLARVRNIGRQVTAAILRKQDEEALTASEIELRALFASMHDVVLVIDRDGVYRKIAPTNPALLVKPPEELLGKNLKDVFPIEIAVVFCEVVQQVLDTKQSTQIEYDLVIADRIVWFQTTISLLNADSTLWVAHDITNRKQAEEALRTAEANYHSIFENATVGIYQSTPQGRFLSVNPVMARIFGYESPEEMLDSITSIEKQYYVDLADRHEFQRLLMEQGEVRGLISLNRRKDGGQIWVQENARTIKGVKGNILHYEGFITDITEWVQAEEALRESEDRYRDLVENSQELICTHDLEGRILSANPWATKVLGYDLDAILQMSIRDFLAPEARGGIDAYLAKIQKRGVAKGLLLIQTAAGERRIWEYNNTLRTEGVAIPVVRGMARDITERKQAEKELNRSKEALKEANLALQTALTREKQLSHTDALTGINNRRFLFELAEREFDIAIRYRHPLSVIMFDIDHFKGVNDMFGHAAGDQILQRVTQIACTELRSADVIGRYGGEEFVIMLPVTNARQANPVAERIRAGVAAMRVSTPKGDAAVTISLGISETILKPQDESVENMIRRADEAMYTAKQAGRNRTVIFDAE